MEILGLALLIVAVAMYYGFFNSAETVARMANRRVERLEAEQIKEDIKFYASSEIKDDEYKGALSAKEQFKQFRDL